MHFVLKNAKNRYLAFDQSCIDDIAYAVCEAPFGGLKDPLTRFLYQFELKEIPKDLCDQIANDLLEGLKK